MSVDRKYAHFHRLLSELLGKLIANEQTLWLGKEGHIINPDHEKNTYRKAIYVVDSLAPYEEQLQDLAQVQQEVMASLGVAKPYVGILLPKVLTDVTRVRLHTRLDWVSERFDKGKLVSRLNKIIATAENNLKGFEAHRSAFDAGYERLRAEVEEAKVVRERVRQSPEQDYRYRTAQELRNPYIYRGQARPVEAYVINHGLIVAGQLVTIERTPPFRRERSDKVDAPILFENKFNRIYLESDWQAAKAKR